MIQSAPIHPASSAVSECFQPDQYLPFFKEWFNRLQASLEKSLPRFDPDFDVLLPAVRTLASITQQNTEEEKRQQLEQIAIVEKVLDAYPLRNIFNDQDPPGEDHTVNGSIEAELIARTVLAQASPERLSEWCKLNHPINKSSAISVVQQLLDFLHNVPLMRLFLESGGARNGQYGPAIQIYHQLLNGDEQQQNPWNKDDLVLNRLALAVALELADPYHLFNTETTGHSTNASLRFKHYALAYQSGDLDPAFAQFTVWELRHAINSDATEEELAVGRASLLAYRPDIALLNREAFDDAKWRYAFVVKTDVAYTTPDWYKPSRSYDQILSGGGKVAYIVIAFFVLCLSLG